MAGNKEVEIEITSAVAIGGKVIVPGKGPDSQVSVDHRLAVNLFNRGKATLVSENAGFAEDPEDLPLVEMTVPNLKKLAADYGVDGAANMKKADLIAAIDAAEDE